MSAFPGPARSLLGPLALPTNVSDGEPQRAKTPRIRRRNDGNITARQHSGAEPECPVRTVSLSPAVVQATSGRRRAARHRVAVQAAEPGRADPPVVLVGDHDVECGHGPAAVRQRRNARNEPGPDRTVMRRIDLDADGDPAGT